MRFTYCHKTVGQYRGLSRVNHEFLSALTPPVSSQMTIVIVGGGPTGVELAGACAELAHRVLRRDFHHVDPGRARIMLVEGSPRVLAQFPEDLSIAARERLEQMGVQV